MINLVKSFAEWLFQSEPDWKVNLNNADEYLFKEVKMRRERVEELLERLHEYGIFDKVEK